MVLYYYCSSFRYASDLRRQSSFYLKITLIYKPFRVVTAEYNKEACPGDYFFILRGILLKERTVN